MAALERLAHRLDTINEWLGKVVSLLAFAMVVMMCLTVIQRYLFHTNTIWQQEMVRFMHAALFLVAAGFTLRYNEHVRVDVFYERFSSKVKAWVNLLGTVCFLFPVSIALIYFSYDFVIESWRIWEGSPEYNGLPGLFLLKTLLWVFSGTLLLQGTSIIIRSLQHIRGKDD